MTVLKKLMLQTMLLISLGVFAVSLLMVGSMTAQAAASRLAHADSRVPPHIESIDPNTADVGRAAQIARPAGNASTDRRSL